MEGRIVPATVIDNGTTTLTIHLDSNETFSSQSMGSSYVFTLGGGSYTFTNNGASASYLSGFGTNTLTVNSSGVAKYTNIKVTDSGASSSSVSLLNSGTNSYAATLGVTLANNNSGSAVQIAQSNFSGSAGLSVGAAGGIYVSGAITSTSGEITLSGGDLGTLTGGIGLNIQAPITTTTGEIDLYGTGGTSTSQNDTGVQMIQGAMVTSTSGPITIDGTSGDDSYGGQDGVGIYSTTSSPSGVTSATGDIQIIGESDTNGVGVGLSQGVSIRSTGTGEDAATISISGVANAADGFEYSGANSSITSVEGDITISGTTGTGSSGGNAGAQIDSPASISSTGTDPTPAAITIVGMNTGPGDGLEMYENSSGTVAISSVGVGDNSGEISLSGTSAHANGVHVSGASTSLSTVDGDIAISGTAGASSSGAGVLMYSGVSISTSGADSNAGSIVIGGTASSGAGVEMYTDSSTNGVSISTNGAGANAGPITITGTSSGSYGVYLQGGSVPISSNDGNIAITGSTSSSNGSNAGVDVLAGATIRTYGNDSNGGTLAVNGTDTGAGTGVLILSYTSTHSSTIPMTYLDINGDGVVNTTDYTIDRAQLGHTL